MRRFYEVRVGEWAPCVEQGVAREELPAGTDPSLVVRAVSAPLLSPSPTVSPSPPSPPAPAPPAPRPRIPRTAG
ncbi:hypothetical protein ACWD7F_05710 [Streptomyces sp. NPDC005122]